MVVVMAIAEEAVAKAQAMVKRGRRYRGCAADDYGQHVGADEGRGRDTAECGGDGEAHREGGDSRRTMGKELTRSQSHSGVGGNSDGGRAANCRTMVASEV